VSEALLLEANLIKRFQPRFNVRLKDDKSYPYIKVTLGDDFPRIERTRKLPNDGSRYFGPYASASSVDEAMNLVRRLFPFRTCTIDIREGKRALQRPCLLYHIKRCQGPCIEAISKADYRADIEQVELFLEGRQERWCAPAPRDGGRVRAPSTSGRRPLRDKVRAIERTMESQKMAAFARTELDLLGFARQDNQAAVQLFAIRDGKTSGATSSCSTRRATRPTRRSWPASSSSTTRAPPRSRARSRAPPGWGTTADLEAFLAVAPGRPVRSVPQRGRAARADGARHAQRRETLAREQARWLADEGKTLAALEELAEALGLPARRCASSATTSATSRARIGRQHGRVRGGPAAHRRVPPLPDPDGRGGQRRRQPPGGAAPALPSDEGRARRGARRSGAGRCRTWSSSTAGRAR
jgi:excinuclease ABC subunit C